MNLSERRSVGCWRFGVSAVIAVKDQAGIKSGDIIVKVNGTQVQAGGAGNIVGTVCPEIR
jgi:hypothetical protein